MAKEISSVALTSLANGEHFTLVQNVLELVESCEVVTNRLSADVAKLKAAFEVEDAKLKLMQKSELTEVIYQNDAIRDSSYTGYKGLVRSFLALPEGEMLAAAKRLWSHIGSYKINQNDSLDRQTGMMTNFIDDLEKKYATEITTLGISSVVTTMKDANEKVRLLMKDRNIETNAKGVGAMKAARAATDEAYRTFMKKLNAFMILEEDADCAALIDKLNAQILHYKRVIGQNVSASEAGTGTDTDAGTTDTTDTSDTGSDVVVGEDSDGHPTVE